MSVDIPIFLTNMTRAELLSPAGDYECFIAAMNAGADAVYLGLSDYGARAFARNLTEEELIDALEIAHILGRKIYLTVNTLLKDDEMERLYDILDRPYRYGLDGVIVQDVGVMSYIHRTFSDLPIHVSTQAGVTSSASCDIYKDLGATRVVPARELSLSEIKKIGSESDLELECFIHGSLCYSYSGKCLLSSFIGGRSGNRGRCAGPCRLMYDGNYPLSLKDLCTIDMIPELIDAGISSFKIEGRMKSSGYVYGVTSIYRKYIDRYYEGDRSEVSKEDKEKLISYYTRSGNCKGYYHAHNSVDMISIDSPSYESSKEAESSSDIAKTPVIPVRIKCKLSINEPCKITVESNGLISETVTDVVPQEALSQALTKDQIIEQLKKSGGTNFTVEDVEVIADNNLFIPKSGLNAVRRKALEEHREKILSEFKRERAEKKAPVHAAFDQYGPAADLPKVNVAIRNIRQLRAAVKTDADGIIIPSGIIDEVIGNDFDPGTKKIYLRLPYIVRQENGSNSREKIISCIDRFKEKFDIEGFYASNAETVSILKEAEFGNKITGDIHLYAYNAEAYEMYKRSGVDNTTVPVELNAKELKRRGITGEELIVYGRIPVMISANCIYNTKNGCRKSEDGHDLYIKDRKGADLFVSCNCGSCTNVIYNSEVLSISDEPAIFDIICPGSVRFEFTDETGDMLSKLIYTYINNRNRNGSSSIKLTDRYTKGHIKRGID